MRIIREPLGVGVSPDNGQRQGRKRQGQRIQLPRGDEEDRRRSTHENPDLHRRQDSNWQGATCGARVTPVDLAVHEAVEGHGAAAGAGHRQDDPEERPSLRPAARGHHGAHQGKRQREDGVLELDHLQDDEQLPPAVEQGVASGRLAHSAGSGEAIQRCASGSRTPRWSRIRKTMKSTISSTLCGRW